ncbi:glycosyl transferase family 90-domain-containing protein [Mycena vulgaris]|nr:glycosyl transferase family 90-domain-containing protein [Mycena vulgaris]
MDALNSLVARLRSPRYVALSSQASGTGHYRQTKITRRRCMASPLAVVVIIAGAVTAFAAFVIFSPRGLPPPPPRTAIEALYARQSASLEQAVARYTLKNDRPPPRGYDQWYRFAKSRGCLIDEYDQIQRDFEPFYQLAKDDPAFFKRMVDRGTQMAIAEDMGMKTFKVENGKVAMTDDRGSSYNGGWMEMLQSMKTILPDMNIIINHRDEPRVAFDASIPHAQAGALNASDAMPFRNAPRPTSKYYKDEKHCIVPNEPKGFMTYGNDASSFLLSVSGPEPVEDIPCFSDIMFPSEFHYARSSWSPKYGFPNNIAWEDKKSALYWRGQSTGGWISGTNYQQLPALQAARHRARAPGHHERRHLRAEYNITGRASPREEGYQYKYVFDVDGNAFSGRYLGLLKSGSLVFKSTLFTEYFDDWLRPFEHYIPVLPDLSDLVDRIEWAIAHDAEARRIQEAGREFAERVLTDAQNDCYFAAVLLEWARLQGA